MSGYDLDVTNHPCRTLDGPSWQTFAQSFLRFAPRRFEKLLHYPLGWIHPVWEETEAHTPNLGVNLIASLNLGVNLIAPLNLGGNLIALLKLGRKFDCPSQVWEEIAVPKQNPWTVKKPWFTRERAWIFMVFDDLRFCLFFCFFGPAKAKIVGKKHEWTCASSCFNSLHRNDVAI